MLQILNIAASRVRVLAKHFAHEVFEFILSAAYHDIFGAVYAVLLKIAKYAKFQDVFGVASVYYVFVERVGPKAYIHPNEIVGLRLKGVFAHIRQKYQVALFHYAPHAVQ